MWLVFPLAVLRHFKEHFNDKFSTTVVEVKKNIHDSYNGLMTANVKTNYMTF